MPVSTRSQAINHEQNGPSEDHGSLHLRNPHHGLKEKRKAFSPLYVQQKKAPSGLKNPSPKPEDKRFSTHPSVDLLSSCKRVEKDLKESKSYALKENNMPTNHSMANSTVKRTFVLPLPPIDEAKENMVVGSDQIIGFSSCTRRAGVSSTLARKLSMEGLGNQTEPRGINQNGSKIVQETERLEAPSSKNGTGESRILVFVRLRPMAKKEKEAGSRCCLRIVKGRDVYLSEFANENDSLSLKRLRGRHFTFDASFPDSATQHEVYSKTTAELVEAVLHGRNGSVFCYGATGAGKTYTMLGTVENPGVMVLAIKDLFTKIRQRSCDGNHVVHLSYLEVYNETVRDLLSPGRPLVLREDKQGIMAAGLTKYRAYSTDEVMALLQRGNHNRTTEPTLVNETSSRSHAILQVVIEYRVKDASMNIVNRVGKLSLIDLAGSERGQATDQRTLRSLEGANINRSLLALSSCINALVEGKKHIPYRNSKLTQLLKDSLGGACNTVMIANISPSNLSFAETQNTLHWADRAKEIRIKASEANEEIQRLPGFETDQAKLLLELQKQNWELRALLARQKQKLLTVQAQCLAANSPPTPSPVKSVLTPPPPTAQPNEKRRARQCFLTGNCLRKMGAEEAVRELEQNVKALEGEIERMKKDHTLQLKKKDELICELSRKNNKPSLGGGLEGRKSIVTRACLRPKEVNIGELKSPSYRFRSPAPTAKKQRLWDITNANSPSVSTLKGRKTRSHVNPEPAAVASMFLQVISSLSQCKEKADS